MRCLFTISIKLFQPKNIKVINPAALFFLVLKICNKQVKTGIDRFAKE
jgi:hypothetical protein